MNDLKDNIIDELQLQLEKKNNEIARLNTYNSAFIRENEKLLAENRQQMMDIIARNRQIEEMEIGTWHKAESQYDPEVTKALLTKWFPYLNK